MPRQIPVKPALVFVVVASFFTYTLYWATQVIPFLNLLSNSWASAVQRMGFWWTVSWISSEISDQVGLFIRFVGAAFALAAAYAYLAKGRFDFGKIQKVLTLEAGYYLFYMPFTIFLFISPFRATRPAITSYETAFSYLAQIVLVVPTLIMLSRRLKQYSLDGKKEPLLKWVAIAVSCYAFAFWIKHFMMNIYAVGFGMNTTSIIGFANSTLTLLIAAIAAAYLVLGKKTNFESNLRAIGGVLVVAGAYFAIYLLVSVFDSRYLTWLPMTEFWAVTLLVLGAGLLLEKKTA